MLTRKSRKEKLVVSICSSLSMRCILSGTSMNTSVVQVGGNPLSALNILAGFAEFQPIVHQNINPGRN